MFNGGGKASDPFGREVGRYLYLDQVDALHGAIKDEVEVIEGPA